MSEYGNPRFGALLRAARARRPGAVRWAGGPRTAGDLGSGVLSLAALARAAGYDATMLVRMEGGERLPTLAGFARIAAALGLDDAEIADLVRAAAADCQDAPRGHQDRPRRTNGAGDGS